MGSSCSAQRDLCNRASPQFHIGAKLPPIFIGHGNANSDVTYSQFTAFVASYKRANGPITEFTADQGPHTYWGKPQWFQPNAEATLNFLKKNL
ncbi:MAG TPA: hypothetical protein VIX90_14010 [Edaphobacter sp.]